MTLSDGGLLAASAADEKAARRFLAKVKVDNETGCWLWRGCVQDSHKWDRARGLAITKPNWRGRFHLHGRKVYAHRAAWLLFRGEVGTDLLVMHVECDNSLCVNPWHLTLGTHAENTEDMCEKQRGGWLVTVHNDSDLHEPIPVPF